MPCRITTTENSTKGNDVDTDTIVRKIMAIVKPDVDQHRVSFVADRLLDLIEEVAESDREDGFQSGYDLGYEDGRAEGESLAEDDFDRGYESGYDDGLNSSGPADI
jgi:hypothetical protein